MTTNSLGTLAVTTSSAGHCSIVLYTVLSISVPSVGVVTNKAAAEARPQHAEGSTVHCIVLSSSMPSNDMINENGATNEPEVCSQTEPTSKSKQAISRVREAKFESLKGKLFLLATS